ncbi:unnamed protein product [Cyprideis torosa]|uniref:Uncharacterized protein n=1 Tax=Cyprideis torosa TaxID=163714 RepID=A0A7R8W6L0_9CRUS|nr:unnamed protein product [Cyprideis torosa]CAG0881186.1 unnamed protein product [Cyprideis torosa]
MLRLPCFGLRSQPILEVTTFGLTTNSILARRGANMPQTPTAVRSPPGDLILTDNRQLNFVSRPGVKLLRFNQGPQALPSVSEATILYAPGFLSESHYQMQMVARLGGPQFFSSPDEIPDPPDFESISSQWTHQADSLCSFPSDDIGIRVIPRTCRLLSPVLADNVGWRLERALALEPPPPHQYEADRSSPDKEDNKFDPSTEFSASNSPTPRGSWASSIFDLHSFVHDPLLPKLLDSVDASSLEEENARRRHEGRPDKLFSLCPQPDEPQGEETRLPADIPSEHLGHRILVMRFRLKLEVEIEPIFATLALYDAKEGRKISENFYFDLNPDPIKSMLRSHSTQQDLSSLSRRCIFDITFPNQEIFLVIRLEKVLQGDINEALEPYLKEEKQSREEKWRAQAHAFCERLGQYRMPFAWTYVSLAHVIKGVGSLERGDTSSEKGSSASLDRKSTASFDSKRRNSTERRSFHERGTANGTLPGGGANADDFASSLDCFRAVTLTVSSFFKQETDKLRDDDILKFLADHKRPTSSIKRLKSIPGTLQLDISPCPMEVKGCVNPELLKLKPYPPEEVGPPTKEILEFPSRELYLPHYQYRNLLYMYIRDVNFTNRPGGSARNITVKVRLMRGEDERMYSLPAIFGKSSGPEFVTKVYTPVTYHNKCPDFYEEVKIGLPVSLTEQHHLFFTFYHISCQRKEATTPVETPIGYSWLPLLRDHHLVSGDFSLPISLDFPPPNYSSFSPDQTLINGVKWLDNHKGLFNVSLAPETSLHPQDKYLDRFFRLVGLLEQGALGIPEAAVETEVRKSIQDLTQSNLESLVNFLPLLLDKLILLMISPPVLGEMVIDISQSCFEGIAQVVRRVTVSLESQNDGGGRNPILTSYIQYHATFPPSSTSSHGRRHSSSLLRSLDRSGSFGGSPVGGSPGGGGLPHCPSTPNTSISGGGDGSNPTTAPFSKHLFEELALKWVVSCGNARELAATNAWFFFELLVKSMVEYLHWTGRLSSPRRERFGHRFIEDLSSLVTMITDEVISRYRKDTPDLKVTSRLNAALAFFVTDLFSVLDRGFVMTLVSIYCQKFVIRMAASPDMWQLASLKLRLTIVRILAIMLSIPAVLASSTGTPMFDPRMSSPPKRHSDPMLKWSYASLTPEFKGRHFLIGLVLTEVANVLEHSKSQVLQLKAVSLIRCLLSSHDADPRLSRGRKGIAAMLYLPLISITLQVLHRVHYPDIDGLMFLPMTGVDESPTLDQRVASAIAGGTVVASKTSRTKSQKRNPDGTTPTSFSIDASRDLMICLLWVLKNIDPNLLKDLLVFWSPSKGQQLLLALQLSLALFKYDSKCPLDRSPTSSSFRKPSNDLMTKLEGMIFGGGSARSELMRRRGNQSQSASGPSSHESMTHSTSGFGSERLRWKKEMTQYSRPQSMIDSSMSGTMTLVGDLADGGQQNGLAGNLTAEVTMVVLDTLETMVKVASSSDSHQDLLSPILRVLLHCLSLNQSTSVLECLFETQRLIVFKFPNLLFDEATEQCADLCLRLLSHSSSSISTIRSQAAASLYMLMRQNFEIGNNFARVKMQVTMSLSSLVGTQKNFQEECLRRSLKTVLTYAEKDNELRDTTFPEQVKDLVFNLHMILSDTVKMRECQEDPEMLIDLMFRIAKGYQNSPDLRLTWLANMAQKHTERENHVEAAMCYVHSAALVAEYLHMLEEQPYLPIGAVSFDRISPNVLEESAVSDDVVNPDEEGVCTGKFFSQTGLVTLLEQAAASFDRGGIFEMVNEVYKVVIPILEAERDYKKLAQVHSSLQQIFIKIDTLKGKRVFGSYFRVGFYGSKFGDLDGEEFVYREPTLTKLSEISDRLEAFYTDRFGSEGIRMIKGSAPVDPETLDRDKAHIQITYVEPFFEPFELRRRKTAHERNYGIKRFIYATPFTLEGRPRGELKEQHKRKTILTVGSHFPYVRTRIQVVHKEEIILTPIEVAIEDIQKKISELTQAIEQDPPDAKILQMVLQGCVGTTVNQGPLEIAHVFLSDLKAGTHTPTRLQNKLRLAFREFSNRCGDALQRNRTLIESNQREYQRELQRNYELFTEQIKPMITLATAQVNHNESLEDPPTPVNPVATSPVV